MPKYDVSVYGALVENVNVEPEDGEIVESIESPDVVYLPKSEASTIAGRDPALALTVQLMISPTRTIVVVVEISTQETEESVVGTAYTGREELCNAAPPKLDERDA